MRLLSSNKNKIEMMNEDFSNLPHPLSPSPPPLPPNKTTLKNAANTKATSFDCAPDRKKRAQEVEKAYNNCEDKFIPVKKTEIKKRIQQQFLRRVIENNNSKMKTYSFEINDNKVREYKQFY